MSINKNKLTEMVNRFETVRDYYKKMFDTMRKNPSKAENIFEKRKTELPSLVIYEFETINGALYYNIDDMNLNNGNLNIRLFNDDYEVEQSSVNFSSTIDQLGKITEEHNDKEFIYLFKILDNINLIVTIPFVLHAVA